jgi:hypothetical protein
MEGVGGANMAGLLTRLLEEAQQLVAVLPEQDAADMMSSLMQSDSVISAAMRNLIISEGVLEMNLDSAQDLNRRVSELGTPRSTASLTELTAECRALFDLLPPEVSDGLLASIQAGESPVAAALRRRYVSDEELGAEILRARSLSELLGVQEPSEWPAGLESLVQESRRLIESLPKEEATTVMRALLEGNTPIAAALRKCFETAPPTPRRLPPTEGHASAENSMSIGDQRGASAVSPGTKQKRSKDAAKSSSLSQRKRLPTAKSSSSGNPSKSANLSLSGGYAGATGSVASVGGLSASASSRSSLKLGMTPRSLELSYIDTLNSGIDEMAFLRQALAIPSLSHRMYLSISFRKSTPQ